MVRENPREIKFTTNINPYADGSVMAEFGKTRVHITAIIQDEVPHFLKGKGTGWLTAEYSLLPMSTNSRFQRERKGVTGRTQEIQRLIGRSLRAALDLKKLGEKSIMIDCDVIVADGGTRTTAISGSYVALALAVGKLLKAGKLKESPLIRQIAAISVGVTKDGNILADLNYDEDSSCETDFNIVMTNKKEFIELQGTAEGKPFSHEQLLKMVDCGQKALEVVFKEQNEVLK